MDDKNKNLETFFQQKFSAEIPPEPWNDPGDDLWKSIEQRIETKPNRKPVSVMPWIIAGLSFLSSLMMWSVNQHYDKKISDLERKIEQCDGRIGGQKTSNVEKQIESEIQTSSSILSPLETQHLPVEDSNSPSKKISNNPHFLNYSSTAQLNSAGNPDFRAIQNHSRPSSILETKKSLSTSTPSSRNLEASLNQIFPIYDNISLTELKRNRSLFAISSLEEKVLMTPKIFPVVSAQLRSNNFSNFSYGPSSRYFNWEDKNIGIQPNVLSETVESESTKNTIAYGIEGQYVINKKFVVSISALYGRRTQSTSYDLNIPYTLSTEVSKTNKLTNSFSHSLPTGLGDINTSLTLSRSSNSIINDKEEINLDFSFDNDVSNLTVPVQIQYHPKGNNGGLFIGAGIQNDFTLSSKINNTFVKSNHTFVKEDNAILNFDENQATKITTSIVGSIGYQKQLFKNVDLSFSAMYGHALNDLYQSGDYHHKLNHFSLGLSLLHSLK